MSSLYVLQYKSHAAYGWKLKGCWGTKEEFMENWLFVNKEQAAFAAMPGDRIMLLNHPQVLEQLAPRLRAWEYGHHE